MSETIVTFSVPNLITVTIMAVVGMLILQLVTAQVRKSAARK